MATIDVLVKEHSAFQLQFFRCRRLILAIRCGLNITLPQMTSTPHIDSIKTQNNHSSFSR